MNGRARALCGAVLISRALIMKQEEKLLRELTARGGGGRRGGSAKCSDAPWGSEETLAAGVLFLVPFKEFCFLSFVFIKRSQSRLKKHFTDFQKSTKKGSKQ